MNAPLLAVNDLHVTLRTRDGGVELLRGVDLALAAGRTLAVVGESGCGKSLTARAIIGLLDGACAISAGSIRFEGREIAGDESAVAPLRGDRIALIAQDPMSALNPVLRIGDQVAETLVAHRGLSWHDARRRAVELLDRTRIADAALRARQYPFELSGGMLQRAAIASAIACAPALLIADEPTTALDVTVQEQVLALLAELQRDNGMAMLLITHDLGVVARAADDVAVMYAGRVVEQGSVAAVFAAPLHPYTIGLRHARPGAHAATTQALTAIPGAPPRPEQIGTGCAFAPRCTAAMRICARSDALPMPEADAHRARCWRLHPSAGSSAT